MKSPDDGTSDQRSRLRSRHVDCSVLPTYSSKTSSARRKSPDETSRGVSAAARNRDLNSEGRTRMNAASNSVSSASAPPKIRTCVRSAGSPARAASARVRAGPPRSDLQAFPRRTRCPCGRCNREIGRDERQVADVELLRRVQSQLVETGDDRQAIEPVDAPCCRRGPAWSSRSRLYQKRRSDRAPRRQSAPRCHARRTPRAAASTTVVERAPGRVP